MDSTFCSLYLQNGVGLSYPCLCQNISELVKSQGGQKAHNTRKLLMKNWMVQGIQTSCMQAHTHIHQAFEQY